MTRTYQLTEEQAVLVHKVVNAHCQATLNHIARFVENDETVRAKNLVSDLRLYQEIFAKTNVEAHRQIDAMYAASGDK